MTTSSRNPNETDPDDIWRDSMSYDEYIERRLDESLSTPPIQEAKDAIQEVKTDEGTWLGSMSDTLVDIVPSKFNEEQYLEEIRDYLAGTYKAHYATGSIQAFELIDSAGLAEGFTMGSVIKYASRYGKKNGHNRKDLLKIIHYALLQLYVHDKEGYENGKDAN